MCVWIPLQLEGLSNDLDLGRESLNQRGAFFQQVGEVSNDFVIVGQVFFRQVIVHALRLFLTLELKGQSWLIFVVRTLSDGKQRTLCLDT